MPLPPNAVHWSQPMDPADVVDYQTTLSQGETVDPAKPPFLQPGESIAEFTLAVTADAAAAGLVIRDNELLTSDAMVGGDDVLEVRPVMSGGGGRP